MSPSATTTCQESPAALTTIREEWDGLLGPGTSPFLTAEWITAWWRAFGSGARVLLLRDADDRLIAGACVERRRSGRLSAAVNAHTGDWDVVAATPSARAQAWQAVASLGANRVHLRLLPRLTAGGRPIAGFFQEAGYRVVATSGEVGPRLPLPGSWSALVVTLSRNHRAQLARKHRALEKAGRLSFRTNGSTDPHDPALLEDLEMFIALEGSGWKGRAGTAICSSPQTRQLYREFALAAAARGWLRLHFLEIDGHAIAADLECVFNGGSFLIKTGFDERFSQHSPGLVLRGEVLQAAIERGSSFYDFLGLPDAYKLRWGAAPRQTWTVDAFRGPWLGSYEYHAHLRPALRRTYLDLVRHTRRA